MDTPWSRNTGEKRRSGTSGSKYGAFWGKCKRTVVLFPAYTTLYCKTECVLTRWLTALIFSPWNTFNHLLSLWCRSPEMPLKVRADLPVSTVAICPVYKHNTATLSLRLEYNWSLIQSAGHQPNRYEGTTRTERLGLKGFEFNWRGKCDNFWDTFGVGKREIEE